MRRLNARHFKTEPYSTPAPRPLWDQQPGKLAEPAAPSPALALSRDIRVATPADVKYVIDLQKRFSNHLGFLPAVAIKEYVDAKRVGIAFENGEPAGYVLGRDAYRSQPLLRPICQAAVQMDAQRKYHGEQLVKRVVARAQAAGQLAVQAVCAGDLESNAFWKALGFEQIDSIVPDNARGRVLIIWRKLTTDVEPSWFWTGPKYARSRGPKKES